ncbi:hypothetical protein BZA05DRAFT_73494 [Tricharina praecox]|uniref:uncharacterized protein n=1 Tax=Tricharina praecox TaxID=43433 RepID=UPI00221FDA36|nr:uncharacterized protein BZA05DRAFT_73494 [Tricharina praecox]KAI5849692.1 hypothetical protein BZA05DRAFT_73494 [Tricharina praecox]
MVLIPSLRSAYFRRTAADECHVVPPLPTLLVDDFLSLALFACSIVLSYAYIGPWNYPDENRLWPPFFLRDPVIEVFPLLFVFQSLFSCEDGFLSVFLNFWISRRFRVLLQIARIWPKRLSRRKRPFSLVFVDCFCEFRGYLLVFVCILDP